MNESEVNIQKQNKFIEVVDKIRRNIFFKILVLFIACILVTVVSLKYSVGSLGERMYDSYFENKYILIMNFLPIFWLSMLILAMFNKVSISYLIASSVTYILTLVNYFKMSLRDDNLLMEDITLIREALKIKTGYTFDISKGMIGYFVYNYYTSKTIFFIKQRCLEEKRYGEFLYTIIYILYCCYPFH